MRIILIILDGCAVTSLKDAPTPFFDRILEEGVGDLNCKAVFPTATYTGHSSIITGCYPNKTGMVANQYYDREQKISKHFDNYDPNIHIEMPTIFEYLKKLRPISISEPVFKGAYDYVSMKEVNKKSPQLRNEIIYNLTLKYLKNENIKFIMINFSAVDSIGEIYSPNSNKYKEELEKVDKYIENIYNISKKTNDTLLIITADHGLTDIKSYYNLQDDLLNNGLNTICLNSHRIAHLYVQQSEKNDLISFLKNNKKIKHVFYGNKINELKVEHKRTGDLIVVAEDKVELEVKGLKGSHGGLNIEEITVPLLFFGIESLQFELKNSKIIDILPTILNILKIQVKNRLDGKSLLIK
ncbi:MAG: alkaline phosphatase family protein [Candidatus Helarchaeota archaeon]